MSLNPSEDIRSVTELKRKTKEILSQLHRTRRPVVLTVNLCDTIKCSFLRQSRCDSHGPENLREALKGRQYGKASCAGRGRYRSRAHTTDPLFSKRIQTCPQSFALGLRVRRNEISKKLGLLSRRIAPKKQKSSFGDSKNKSPRWKVSPKGVRSFLKTSS